jgi:predicted deacylase
VASAGSSRSWPAAGSRTCCDFGVLAGKVRTRESMGRQPATILRATDINDYPLAPESGLFEALVHLGQHVAAGQPLLRLHFLELPTRPPEVITSPSSGVVCSIRAIAATQRRNNLFLIGHPITLEEALA